MRQYYLVPVTEMDEMEQRCVKMYPDEEKKNKQAAKSLLNNEFLSNSKKLELFANNFIPSHQTNISHTDQLDDYTFMQSNLKFVPEKFKQEAVELIKELKKNNVLLIDNTGMLTLVESGHKMPMPDFLRGVFQMKASVLNYKGFFTKIARHLNDIRNPMLVKLKNSTIPVVDDKEAGISNRGGIVNREVKTWIERCVLFF